ncbi:hypothetical protein [Prevotella sp. oral taxon 376]|uniref:hypothetical protein n=1 Tax=Prevotella sp. oral taxon 376 TaxID=712466 RepID=UPI0011B23448|nr:hypothetical protein [Prevotella sp. oral taxon 376]
MWRSVFWLTVFCSLVFCSCKKEELPTGGNPDTARYPAYTDSLGRPDSMSTRGLLPFLTVRERPSGFFASLFGQEICSQKFYCDTAGRPVHAVYSQRGFPDEHLRFTYTDSSFITREGRSGRCEYLLREGLIVAGKPLGHGTMTRFVYDAARHLVRAGQTDYVWEGARLTAVRLKSPDGRLMIERKVDYDEAKPVSQTVMAELFAHYWGKWWLLPFLQKGYFGEFPVGVPYRISYPDGHFDLYRSVFGDDGRLASIQSVGDGIVRDYRWEDWQK